VLFFARIFDFGALTKEEEEEEDEEDG